MIYVTGDMHGDIGRFRQKQVRKLRKNDTLIVCGDFGFVWDGSEKEKRILKWIGKRRYQVLFVEGCHDNLDLLAGYPQTQWQGGIVREISGKLKLLCRGSVFEIEGQKIFAFGGGSSEDSEERLSSKSWWPGELPNEDEIALARDMLGRHGNVVDFIVTHQSSRRIKQFLHMDSSEISNLDTFLDEVRETVNFKKWYFGSVHFDKNVPPNEVALFRAVVPMQKEQVEIRKQVPPTR